MADQAIPLVTRSWIVPRHQEPRVDAFVRRCLPHLSRREIENAIRAKFFSVGSKTSKKGDRLASGDELVFHGPATWLATRPLAESGLRVEVVYEDASILVVNKPAGVATHGFSGSASGTLANLLLASWPALAHVGTSRWEPGLVHRIDQETSGLVLVAKTDAAFAALKSQFRRRRVKKTYWALVWGVADNRGEISLALAHDRQDPRRMRAVARPSAKERTWQAATRYRTLDRSQRLSLLEVDMETGVTHQLRVHLAAIGHPIVGDRLYGGDREAFGLKRHFLHARRLVIDHPGSGEKLTMEAELPPELAGVLGRLKIKP